MSNKNADEKIINNIDEAEAAVYSQIFGIFDKDNGDFIKVKSEEKTKEIEEPKKKKERKKAVRKTKSEIKDEVDMIIQNLSEKDISSMVITIKINGVVQEYVNEEKAGEKYLSKEAQIEKIKETVNGFKNIVIVHSEEELQKLQEEFKMKQEKSKATNNKNIDNKDKNTGNKTTSNKESLNEPEVKTRVYIRISEKDFEKVEDVFEKEKIKIMANKVQAREDKSGINMVIKIADSDKVRNILKQNNISVLQDVDGNIDWDDIKERSNKHENVTVEQLRDFQNKNSDKFDYIAFKKDEKYTIFTDKRCDISIGSSGRKTLKQLETKVENYRNNSPGKMEQKVESKLKDTKEEVR